MQKQKLDGKSLDNVALVMDGLRALIPDAFTEGRLDQDALLTLLGDEIDNDREKYQFVWKGKQEALQIAQRKSSATLRPAAGESKNWDTTQNLYIEGDNLEVLKLLQAAYLRKIKMIYIDPPYNTGNDFVYKDDFKDPMAQYKAETGQIARANPETAGRYHSNWLSMMYPRLKLAKTLLRDDGVIFISIDDNEVHNLRKLMDEVFGEENFLAQLVWKKKYTGGKNTSTFADYHEYILAYARSADNLGEISMARPTEETDKFTLEDEYLKERGKFYIRPLKSNLDPRPTLVYPIELPDGTFITTQWICAKDTYEQLKADGRIWLKQKNDGTYQVYKKFYENDGGGKVKIPSFLEISSNNEAKEELKELFGIDQTRDLPFQTPKPTKLLRLFVENFTSDNDIVLDFFAGSSSTAHAVMLQNAENGNNRQFIMVQLPEITDANSEAFKMGFKDISDIGKERIRRAGDKILSEITTTPSAFADTPSPAKGIDTGFRVFKLDSSNLTKWDDDFAQMSREQQTATLFDRMEKSLDELKPDRREIDVIYEILIKYGIPLTEQIATIEITTTPSADAATPSPAKGTKFYVVGADGLMFICLDENLSVDVIQELIKTHTPGTIIFADRCFASDDVIANAILELKKAQIEFRWI